MMVRELLWLLLVAEMAVETQQQSAEVQSSSTSSFSTPGLVPPPLPPPSPVDDNRSSGGTNEDQLRMMTTLPSEDEGLNLATGETAILECRVSSAAAASVALDKNLSWTNAMTNTTMTTQYTAFQNTSLIYQTLVESNQTSLVLTMSNLTVARSEFRCELDIDENTRTEKTVKVNVLSSDVFCTFEGEMTCAWDFGKAWTRKSSSPAASDPARCDAGFPDHTYGKDNVNGHYLIARVTGDQLTEGGTLYTTLRNGTECVRFYYRTCKTNDSRGGAQLMYTMKDGMPSTINLSLALDWTERILFLPPQNQEQHQIILSVTYSNASDFAYIAIDDIRTEDGNCDSADQQVTKTDPISESGSLLQAPTSTTTTNTALTTTSSTNSQSSASKTASTSTVSSSTTTTATQPTSTTSASTASSSTTTTASSSSLPPTAVIQSTVISPRLTSLLAAPTGKRTPDEGEDSVRPTDDDRRSAAAAAAAATDEGEEDADDETAAAATAAAKGDNSTGLAIGIILAIMVAGACTAAILYRRRKNGKKSTYITFGNPSYSREHLPVNDFGLDSPLTLSSNGYTVLA